MSAVQNILLYKNNILHMQKKIRVFLLTMLNISAVLSIRNWPISAEYGLQSIIFISLSLLFFFIPTALIAAELSTGWSEKGGLFIWIKEAFGGKIGLFAVWLLWIENVIWFPTILSFIATSIAYGFFPHLIHNKWYTFDAIFFLCWIIFAMNIQGIHISGWLSSICVILGTLLPGFLIISLGIIWLLLGQPSQIVFSLENLKPTLTNLSDISFLAGMFIGLAGIEMNAVHSKEVIQPKKTFPRAILLSTIIITILTFLGTLSIATIISKGEIFLLSGGVDVIYRCLSQFHLQAGTPIIALLIAIGSFGAANAWSIGSCKAMLSATSEGKIFPQFLQKTNRRGAPVALLLLQEIIVVIFSFAFIFMPTINSSYWMITILASQIYAIMYLLLFASAVTLRYKRNKIKRAYQIPGGHIGIWTISLIGSSSSLFVLFSGFIPPQSLHVQSTKSFVIFLIFGLIIFCLIPFLYIQKSKPKSNSIHY